ARKEAERMRTAVVVSLLAPLALSACGGKAPEPPSPARPETSRAETRATPPAAAASAGFKVALLSPGPVSDAGWNAAAYEGLKRIEKELGASIAQAETKTPPQFESGFREYARQGYRLVFGHGFEFQDAAAKVGAEF